MIVVLVNEEVVRSEDIESSQLANIESSESSQLSIASQLSLLEISKGRSVRYLVLSVDYF